MRVSLISYKYTIFFICIMFTMMSVHAQSERIIVTEVYLDENNPSNNWIELYNPSEKSLELERFRFSHIRTIDILPKGINRVVEPKSYLIICADSSQFETLWGKVDANLIQVLSTGEPPDGGFIGITTKNAAEAPLDIICFGNPLRISNFKDLSNHDVIPFSKVGKSHSRVVSQNIDGYSTTHFQVTDPTPGE